MPKARKKKKQGCFFLPSGERPCFYAIINFEKQKKPDFAEPDLTKINDKRHANKIKSFDH